jgi:hypothetical protein
MVKKGQDARRRVLAAMTPAERRAHRAAVRVTIPLDGDGKRRVSVVRTGGMSRQVPRLPSLDDYDR